MKIHNIIFDIGNVLFGFEPSTIIESIIPGSPYKQDYLQNLYQSDIWQKLDLGIISDRKAVNALVPYFKSINPQKVRSDLLKLMDQFIYHMIEIPQMIALFNRLRELKFNRFLLSNFPERQFEKLCILHPFLLEVDGMAISGKVKCKKPDPKIYHSLLSHYHINPGESVFIDDLKENIDTANQIGICGIQMTSFRQVKSKLSQLLNQEL